MHYLLSGAPSTTPEHQRGELERLVRHAAPTATFVTVAGSYKPVRVRLTLVTVPERLAEPVLQGLRSLYGDEEAIKTSAPVRQRAEWRHAALLLPVEAGAPALDGRLLEGWDSACLTVQYAPGKAAATLVCCAEDAPRLARLAPEGWQRRDLPLLPAGVAALVRQGLARRWTGVPSLLPVPGAAPIPRPVVRPATAAAPATTTETATTTTELAADLLDAQARAALTEAEDGLVVGVGRDGSPVRLARRSQLLSLAGPEASLKSAVLAFVTRAMQARVSVVLAVPRSLLPQAVLTAWEERVRWLDIQRPQDSATLRWRAIAPDLLADALGVEPALLPPPLPSHFGALLEQIDASDLRIAPLLTLTAGPGDDLHQVLRAGGLIVVPQDGDVASELVARLVLAALATPPAVGCGLLLVLDPALAAPQALAAQAIQVVVGGRPAAQLRMEGDVAGWQLRTGRGTVLADLQADLLLDASGGRPELIQAVLNALGASEMPLDPVGRSEERVGEAEAIPAEEALFWEAIPAEEGDLDNLGEEADPVEAGALLGGEGVGGGDPAEAILVEEGVGGADPVAPGEGDPAATGAILSEKVLPWEAILAEEGAGEGDLLMGGDPVAGETEELPSARDEALDALLTALLELSAATEAEAQVQATVADENWTLAELAVRAWLLEQAHDARPWAWLAVLVADDRERSDAARQALIRRPDPALLPALRAVLEVLEGEEAPDRALLVQLAQGAGAAIGEGAPGLEVGDPAAALPDLGLPVAAEGEGAPGLAPLGDPALPQFGSSWAWPDLGLAAPVEPGDPGLPVLDAQDQAPAELGDPDLSWFPFALPDPAAHDPVSGAIPEEWGDLPGEAADRPPEAEPILGFPAWVPLEPAPLWGDPEVLEREVLAGIAPTEQADPPFQVMSAAGSPRTLGGDPGLDDKPALAVERLDDTLDDAALVRAWQGGATSTELVALLVAAGVERAEARQRVRAILRAGAETPTAPPLPLAHLVVGLPDPALEGGDLLASPPDRPLVDLGLPLADPGLGQGDPALGAGALLPSGGTVWPLAALPDPVWEWGDPVLVLPDPVLATEDRPPIDLDQTQGDPALERGDPLLEGGDPLLEGGDPTLERGDPVPTSGAELLTSKGVAEILGCQDGYVRKLISAGRLPAVKDERGYNRVARADVLAYQQQLAERG